MQRLQCFVLFFLSEDGQELAMSADLGVDEAHWVRLSEHRVPGPGQERGMVMYPAFQAVGTPEVGVLGILLRRAAYQ